jgi:hypothetical protein
VCQEKSSVGYRTDDPPDLIPFEGSYPTFEKLLLVAKAYAERHIFGLCRNTKNFTEAQFTKYFGDIEYAPIVRRGYLYCSDCGKYPKQDDPAASNRWRVQFQFSIQTGDYDIDQSLSCGLHNHALKADEIRISNRILLQRQSHLNAEEIQYAHELGMASLGSVKAREMMRDKFPGRDYDGPLLLRLLQTGHSKKYGDDPDAMNKLLQLGQEYRKDGGVFEFRVGDDFRMTDVVVATASMRGYIRAFNDCVVIDGTHGCNTYGMTCIVNTLIDSLGLSVIGGYSHARSEESSHIISALQALGLDSKRATLLSDEANAFAVVAEKLEMPHVLCCYHYAAQVLPARRGLPLDLGDAFMRDCNLAIYHDFGSMEKLQRHLSSTIEKYSVSPSAQNFIKKVIKDQHRICRTHTAYIFTATAFSTQRGESSNSRIKNNGEKKRELKSFNLFQFAKHIESICDIQNEKAIGILSKLIEKGKFWSDFVQQRWQEEFNSHIGFCASSDDDSHFTVCGPTSESIQTKSVVEWNRKGKLHLECSCGRFRNSWIPCRHICLIRSFAKRSRIISGKLHLPLRFYFQW